jgi:predicted mannosyl-3-phosphoglycerate phosphatase (HAD superfamily)
MPVQCPSCQWPSSFSECGPAEDPSILLSGTARIAQGAVQILAIRTSHKSSRIPDYKSDVPRECYQELGMVLERVLEDLEYLASEFGDLLNDNSDSEGIELPTGTYRIVALSSRKTIL